MKKLKKEMKLKHFALVLSSLALLALQRASFAQVTPEVKRSVHRLGTRGKFVPGEVVVTYKENATSAAVASSMSTVRSSKLRQVTPKMVKLNVASDLSVADAIETLSKDPSVESVQPNFIYHAFSLPNDPKVSSSTVANLSLSTAWDRVTDCSAVIVAVLDSGVNYSHEDLASNMWNGGSSYPNHGYDFVDNDNDPKDQNGHGTHVAGIIGAVGNNGVGTSGVCWRANIMALRALDSTGSGSTADIASALAFAGNNGAKVVNMSLGTSEDDAAIRNAISTLNTQGVVVIVAAGNDGTDNDTGAATFPCNNTLANLVCVAALDANNALASFSNTGATSVDVGAPGVQIDSSYAGTETSGYTSVQTGWTMVGTGWTYGTATFGSQSVPMLMNPAGWNGTSTRYAANMDAKIYKTFNLASADVARFEVDGFLDVAAGDFFSVYSKGTGGDPFVSGTEQDSIDNYSAGDNGFNISYDLANCRTATCSLGFRLVTNATTNDFGLGIYYVGITTLSYNNTTYEKLDGTSMATPFVSGVAALLFAYNPSYTAADVVASIKGGGTALSALAGKTTTGKAASADGSLKFIVPPAGVVATVN